MALVVGLPFGLHLCWWSRHPYWGAVSWSRSDDYYDRGWAVQLGYLQIGWLAPTSSYAIGARDGRS